MRRNQHCAASAGSARLRRHADPITDYGLPRSVAAVILRCSCGQAGGAAGGPEEATAAQRPCLSAVHRGVPGGTPCIASPATAPASPLRWAVTGRRPATPRMWCVVWVFPCSVVYLSNIYRHCRQAEGRSVPTIRGHTAHWRRTASCIACHLFRQAEGHLSGYSGRQSPPLPTQLPRLIFTLEPVLKFEPSLEEVPTPTYPEPLSFRESATEG